MTTDFFGNFPPMRRLATISMFTGGMGLDLGFEQVGFCIRVALDNDPAVEATTTANGRATPLIIDDVANVPTDHILQVAGIQVGQATAIIGAPPCEPFTTAGARNGFKDDRADAVHQYIRVVNEAQPEYFVFEEVPGFIRAAKQHMSFYTRTGMREDEIDPDSRLGSAFEEVMESFEALGYGLSLDVDNPKGSLLNAADYGAPQKRLRFVLIGTREGPPVQLPEPTHAAPDSDEVRLGTKKPWMTLRDALTDIDTSGDEHVQFPESWGKYMGQIPEGGCWRDLPEELHPVVLGGAYDDGTDPLTAGKKGGRTGFLRRLAWDRPAPTLVDRPTNKANCLCHPEETRPLSVKEYARIQGFSDDWKFSGSLSQRYRLIGQATPVPLAAAIARQIRKHVDEYHRMNGHSNQAHATTSVYISHDLSTQQIIR